MTYLKTAGAILLAGLLVFSVIQEGGQPSPEPDCEELSIDYDYETVETDRAPEGEKADVQKGETGVRRICSDPRTGDKISDEVVKQPKNYISIEGAGEVPPNANGYYESFNYANEWDERSKELNHDFTEEAHDQYCQAIEDNEDDAEDWELYCSDRDY